MEFGEGSRGLGCWDGKQEVVGVLPLGRPPGESRNHEMPPIPCFTTGDQETPGKAFTKSCTVSLGQRWDLNLEPFWEHRVPYETPFKYQLCVEEDSEASLRIRMERTLCYHCVVMSARVRVGYSCA